MAGNVYGAGDARRRRLPDCPPRPHLQEHAQVRLQRGGHRQGRHVPQVPTGQHNLPLIRPRLQGDLQEQKRLRRVNEEEKGTWKVRIVSIFPYHIRTIMFRR